MCTEKPKNSHDYCRVHFIAVVWNQTPNISKKCGSKINNQCLRKMVLDRLTHKKNLLGTYFNMSNDIMRGGDGKKGQSLSINIL